MLSTTSLFGCEDKWQEIFDWKIIYFTPSSEHELTHFDATDLHGFKTGFNSIDFSADRRLVQIPTISTLITFVVKSNKFAT